MNMFELEKDTSQIRHLIDHAKEVVKREHGHIIEDSEFQHITLVAMTSEGVITRHHNLTPAGIAADFMIRRLLRGEILDQLYAINYASDEEIAELVSKIKDSVARMTAEAEH